MWQEFINDIMSEDQAELLYDWLAAGNQNKGQQPILVISGSDTVVIDEILMRVIHLALGQKIFKADPKSVDTSSRGYGLNIIPGEVNADPELAEIVHFDCKGIKTLRTSVLKEVVSDGCQMRGAYEMIEFGPVNAILTTDGTMDIPWMDSGAIRRVCSIRLKDCVGIGGYCENIYMMRDELIELINNRVVPPEMKIPEGTSCSEHAKDLIKFSFNQETVDVHHGIKLKIPIDNDRMDDFMFTNFVITGNEDDKVGISDINSVYRRYVRDNGLDNITAGHAVGHYVGKRYSDLGVNIRYQSDYMNRGYVCGIMNRGYVCGMRTKEPGEITPSIEILRV